MQEAKNLKEYREKIHGTLENDFLRSTLDNFAVAYRAGRAKAFSGMDEKALINEIAAAKDDSIAHMDQLFEEFKANAEKIGIHVHLAHTAHEANEIIANIAAENDCQKIVKSKSMTAEETHLNDHLEKEGLKVTETDLGEWIIQLRHEGPTHMVMPAIHLSRYQVADLFTDVTKQKQDSEIEKLVKVARRELRQRYVEADMGVTGANFAIADTASLGIVTNEGNARLVSTLPRVHVAMVGLDKLTPNLHDALRILQVLPRNATGQTITSYVSWITGPSECQSAEDGQKQMHIVFLDNGRRALAKDDTFSEVLRCVRCGACANVCPVYRMLGGHDYGHVYIGAIGLILTYFFHGREYAKNLVQNCINCQACKEVCASGIDLPSMIKEIHAQILDDEGHPPSSAMLAKVLRNRKLFHGLLRSARYAQRPVTGGTPYLRHLPQMFAKDHNFRALPAIAKKPFRDQWEDIKPKETNPRFKVAIFSGCVQDFVYPEQLKAAVEVIAGHGVELDYPMDQSCCGLPVQMMGEKPAAKEVAIQNVTAMDPSEYDYILTLCASCASHLKHNYPKILKNESGISQVKVEQFADRVISFSSFIHDVLKLESTEFKNQGKKTTYHAPCHLCRGMGVTEAPRDMITTAGLDFAPADEEQTCCGFGGTYSSKFPELSREILDKKLDDFKKTGADQLVTECPGCVMQLRGGTEKRGESIEVMHIAEALAKQKS
ncbi:MAG: LUD domain-containing protein [Desulfohalobium sp.]